MQYVDYFTFQNYGPSIDVNTYNSMVTACGNFRKQGFPDNKIILSAPFQGTPGGSNPGTYIKGYRDIAANCPEADNPDNDTAVYTYSDGTRTLHYNGVTTIKRKAKYISDQKLAGFMYWDLGLDLADSAGRNNYFDRRSLLRAANRYVSSTSFPDTPSPFSLSRVGAALPAEGGTADVEVPDGRGKSGMDGDRPSGMVIRFRGFRHRPDDGGSDGRRKQIRKAAFRNGCVPGVRRTGMLRQRHAGST